MLLHPLLALADLVLPRRCVGCAVSGQAWCPACMPAGPAFRVAGQPLPVIAAAEYGDAVRSAVVAYKDRGRRDLAATLAGLLRRAVLLALTAVRGPVVLVAAPSARRTVAARGGDHVQRLAHRVARSVGCRAAPGVLTLTREVRDSAGLGRADRARNLTGAMRAGACRSPAAVVVLVDDVITTGATLREAERALTAAGWSVAAAAVVAATPRRECGEIGARVRCAPLVTHSRRV